MKLSEIGEIPPPVRIFEFGDFRMDVGRHLLARRDGEVVPLTPRVFETLRFLVEHSDTVLDKERLMEAVWPDSIVEENNLTLNISKLRQVLGEKPGSHRFIMTVPGRGYRFVAEVKPAEDPEKAPQATRQHEESKRARHEASPSGGPAVPLPAHEPRADQRTYRPFLLAALAILFLGSGAFFWARSAANHPSAAPANVEAKSIAVLPFQDLSDDKETSGFGAGIQDDVLTSLAQIHDLKVISRTSVMAYQKPDGRNMREIGRALGVANVLEGSVRRAGNRVLVNVQLIDARTDRHLWAERYDRTVADAIGLQGELATQIAVALKATLAPEEKARLSVKPTDNSEAYVLYLTALGKEDAIAAEELCVQATAIDPTFALAYARASLLNSEIAGSEQPRARKAKARAQAEEALRLSPTLGEGHMALGLCLYWGDKKYNAALKEFELAAASSPNNAWIYTYVGGIYRRQGRWREARASFDRAVSLDPRNARIVFWAASNRLFMRDWAGATARFSQVLEINPKSPHTKTALAYLAVFRGGEPGAGQSLLRDVPEDAEGLVSLTRWDLTMLERDYAAAEKILSDFTAKDFWSKDFPKTFYQGRTALARGDIESARRYFAEATPVLESWAHEDPDDPERHAGLGLLYAYMQRKEDALRECRRAIELAPESQDAFHGALYQGNLALVYALVGEADQAITLIERLLSTPGPVSWSITPPNITLADLRLRWEWDSLRSNPRFQKILAAPEPQTILPAGH